MSIIVTVMFTALSVRVFNLQIVNEQYYLENYIQKAKKEVLTSGTRGLIYDRNGNVLAYNKLAYSIDIEDNVESSDEKNAILNEIINKTRTIIIENGDTLDTEFKILVNANGDYVYNVESERERLSFLRDVYGKKSIEELDSEDEILSNDSADNVMEYFIDRFDIDKKYTNAEKCDIAAIRYNLSLNSFQKYISTTVAKNVSEETVAAIYEAESELKGVSVKEDTIRVYNDSIYFAPIIGYTGKISDSELSEYNSSGSDYISSDIVGKLGIEKEMESYLQGKKGKNTMFVDNTGRILDIVNQEKSSAGNDVYLTIDSNLQKAAYTILEQKLAGILYSKIVNQEVTVTDTSKTIPIAIKDVYFQMINNNVVDLNKFNLDTASENEKNIYSKFSTRQTEVIDWLNGYLNSESPSPLNELSEEQAAYLEYIYNLLSKTEEIINLEAIPNDDATYVAMQNNTISLREFILYAISKNWINTANLFVDDEDYKYSDTDEIYNAVVKHIFDELPENDGFSKKIYYYLIYNGTISGGEICRLLYDQNVLEYDEAGYNSLLNGSVSAYDFMREQIRTLKITPSQVALDPCSGSVVVTDPNSGNVLALVTYPSYDNNKLSGSVDYEYWKKLNNDLSLPLYNRATQTRTAPGSTFKMAVGITALELGITSPSRTINDLGIFDKITPSPKCWKYPSNHGSINVSQALGESCNYYFYEMGYELSIDERGNFDNDLGLSKVKLYTDELGLTDKSGVEIEENEPIYSTDNSVRSAIGQGSHSYTPVQIARYANTIANGGTNYRLSLLNKVVDSSGNVIRNYEQVPVNTTDYSDSTWNAIHSGMRLVCTSGTAKKTFADFPISVAGKSGTAQENLLRSNHSLFVAYAPYENPEISLCVVIPNGESSGYTAEVVRETIKYYKGLLTDAELFGGTASIPTSGITSD